MASYPRQTPVGATPQYIDSLESTYGIVLRENNGASPVGAGGGRNISFTVPSGHYAKVSTYAQASVVGINNSSITLRGTDNNFISDVILVAGQVVNGTFYYLLFEV